MGDRITTYLPCPKCGKESEQYDAMSSLIWSWKCEYCGWHDDRDYYEGRHDEKLLLTEKEARKKKLIFTCPVCKKTMTWWEKEKWGKCVMCFQEEKKLALKRLKRLIKRSRIINI